MEVMTQVNFHEKQLKLERWKILIKIISNINSAN